MPAPGVTGALPTALNDAAHGSPIAVKRPHAAADGSVPYRPPLCSRGAKACFITEAGLRRAQIPPARTPRRPGYNTGSQASAGHTQRLGWAGLAQRAGPALASRNLDSASLPPQL
nr:hypothetical protein GCM10020063_004220 [Dactylosporangium thailandense]